MTGLLLKDIYTLGKTAKLYVVAILLFALLPGDFMQTFLMMYVAMLAISSISIDEQNRWDELAAMLPYSHRKLVLSKYLLSYLFMAAGLVLDLAATTVVSHLTPRVAPFSWETAAAAAALAVVVIALEMPVLYRFGTARGRLWMMAVFVAIGLTVGALAEKNGAPELLAWIAAHQTLTAAIAAGGLLALNGLSMALSVAFYKRRFR